MRLKRKKDVVRLQLATSDEAFEGILLGRWDGHYQLQNAVLVAMGSDKQENRYKMDGRVAVQAEKVLCYQVLGEVRL